MGMPIKKPEAVERRRVAIGQRIADTRRAQRIDVVAAAARVHASTWTWRRWEAGTHSVPAELMPEVAAALGVTVEHLYGTAPTRAAA